MLTVVDEWWMGKLRGSVVKALVVPEEGEEDNNDEKI